MENLMNHAYQLKQELLDFAAREASEAERNQAEINARAEQSNERAYQFIDIMKRYEIPTVELCGFITYDQGVDTPRTIDKVSIGKGWVIYNYQAAANNDDTDHAGLIILENAESYHFVVSLPREMRIHIGDEVYLSGQHVLYGGSAQPENLEKSRAIAPYCDESSGIANLSHALIRHGVVS